MAWDVDPPHCESKSTQSLVFRAVVLELSAWAQLHAFQLKRPHITLFRYDMVIAVPYIGIKTKKF